VFGPNEYHKGEMISLVGKRFEDAKDGKTVRLFKSHRDGIGDGEQRRDFIYVDDAVAVMRWLLDTPRCRASSISARGARVASAT
jgi:ADP-L-glycero-D-manno-heptose 6-epimerase